MRLTRFSGSGGSRATREAVLLPAHLAGAIQGLEDVGHLPHVVVLAERVAEAEVVGLVLRVASVLQEEHLQSLARQAGELGDVGGDDAADAETERGELGLADLLHGVTGGHVADLVPQHRGELRLRVHVPRRPRVT